MQAIKQCYLAYINSEGHREANDLDEILGDARAMLPIKEYAALDAGVNDYCDALQEKAFVKLMRQPSFGYNTEYTDKRISLFSAQWGKCAVTGQDFRTLDEIHCHHKTPKENGGGDEYGNLVLILEPVHRLIHAKEATVIALYSTLLNLDQRQMAVLNKLRGMTGLPEIN